MSSSELSRRAQKILHAVVTEYLQAGDPVGSRTVTRRHDLKLSPATVRNVMADLEELGLLEQRHSSAGRVPTASGLRFFINELLKVRGMSAREKDEIRERVSAPTRDEVVQRASRLLSDLTQHAAVIITPDPVHQRLSHIENRLIIDDVDPRRLEAIHNYLNQLLKGMTLDEVRERVIRELGEDKNRYDEAVSAALRLGHAMFVARERSADVVISGQANLIDDEMAQANARELLRTLEDKETLIRLLDRTRHAEGLQVFLGAETALSALASSSVIAMPYGAEERPIGALAVIGPMRMNYGEVMSVVDVTADTVSQLLAELGSS